MPGQPQAGPPQAPIFKISLANATLLSVLYLAFAAAVELLRRLFNLRWAELMSEHLEEFPARTLRWFGLFSPLRRAYLDGLLGTFGVRVLLGLTVVALIFAMAVLVGAMMWTARWGYLKVQAGREA